MSEEMKEEEKKEQEQEQEQTTTTETVIEPQEEETITVDFTDNRQKPDEEKKEEEEKEPEKKETSEEEEKTESKSEESEEKPKKSKFQKRIDQLTREKWDAIREKKELETKASKVELLEQKISKMEEVLNKMVDGDFDEEEAKQVMEETIEEPEVNTQDINNDIEFQRSVEVIRHHLDETERQEEYDKKVKPLLEKGELPLTREEITSLADLDNPVDVLFYFAEHTEEAKSLVELPPRKQVIELVKLSAKLTDGAITVTKEKRKTPETKEIPPAPISNPVSSNAQGVKRPDQMTQEEYREYLARQDAEMGIF